MRFSARAAPWGSSRRILTQVPEAPRWVAIRAAPGPSEARRWNPVHAALLRLELGQRCTRHGKQRHIAMPKVHVDAVEIVGPERARLATLFPIRIEHEVVD